MNVKIKNLLNKIKILIKNYNLKQKILGYYTKLKTFLKGLIYKK